MKCIVARELCCGCSACFSICPKKCIKMKEDKNGFLYPVIYEEKCINCGLCKASCPIQNTYHKHENKLNKLKSYIAYNKNNSIRESSSSGGIFTALAECILNDGGIVFGVVLDEQYKAVYMCVEKTEELWKLRGSKYMQSDMKNVYNEVKCFLNKGRKILFSGTACQIEGLKCFLKKDYDNLITVDVLCHGVPSPKVWMRYLEGQKKKNKGSIQNINFRDKSTGWKDYSLKISFDTTEYKNIYYRDNYMRMFISDICLRKSCYNCKFKELYRNSDITLGDCWEIDNIRPDENDNLGVSIILLHTRKGENILKKIEKDLVLIEEDVEKIVPSNSDARKSVKENPKRDKFFDKLNAGYSIDRLMKFVKPNILIRGINKMKYTLINKK